MIKNNKFILILLLSATFLSFFIKAIQVLDPDFGWHIKLGEILLATGIPAKDPFSYTMPNFPFVDHEWATNVLMYVIFTETSFMGLSIFYASIALLSLCIAIFITPRKYEGVSDLYHRIMLVLLSSFAILPSFGIRPQVQSWLFLALLFYLIRKVEDNIRWTLAIIVLNIIWVNMHGSFPLAIVVLGSYAFFRTLRQKSMIHIWSVLFFLSSAISFINPYGHHVWREIHQQVSATSASSVRWEIAEWNPAFFYLNMPFVFLTVYASFLIVKTRKHFKVEALLLYVFFLYQSYSSLRHIPLWVIYMLPLVVVAVKQFEEEYLIEELARKRFTSALKFLVILSLVICSISALSIFGGTARLREDAFYPKKAIQFMRENIKEGNVFSEYGWGGYLIWKYPEKKVFIDGRMATWIWDPPSEASDYASAYNVYQDILKKNIHYKSEFEKWNITYVLWHKRTGKEDTLGQVEKRFREFIGLQEQQTESLFIQLKEGGWRIIYDDDVSFILARE